MTAIEIFDKSGDSPVLVDFERIASFAAPFAETLYWTISDIDGPTLSSGELTISDAKIIAENSLHRRLAWVDLCSLASTFFQIYDCLFLGFRDRDAAGGVELPSLSLECCDATLWRVEGEDASIVGRVSTYFTDFRVDEVAQKLKGDGDNRSNEFLLERDDKAESCYGRKSLEMII